VSILEAFAAGLPVVSTASGDIPSMVRHGETGLLVPVGDVPALADAIEAVWRDPGAARARARRANQDLAAYSWTHVRDQWADVYRRPAPHAQKPRTDKDEIAVAESR